MIIRYLLIYLFFISYLPVLSTCQEKISAKNNAITGNVRNEDGRNLVGANIIVQETGAGCATDKNGNFIISNLKPGSYSIKASFVSYESVTKKVTVIKGKTISINFSLKAISFQIGGIEVVGTSELIPEDAITKTVIKSGEIEHYQASSVKDILDLVPGVQMSNNPGLGKTTQAAIRGDEEDNLSAFGTLVIVDGTPVSNNANLQFEHAGGANLGSSTMGAGVDLRTIPADNIESVEVITGLPSVKYGDVTEGVINIKTKIGKQPNRLKIKNNPDTHEANLSGGFGFGNDAFSYNLNVAQSERDIRKIGDEYTRVTIQSVNSSNFLNNKLNINQKLNAQLVFDEDAPKGDVYQTRNYNRGFNLGYSNWGKYVKANGVSFFEYSGFVNMQRENSHEIKISSV